MNKKLNITIFCSAAVAMGVLIHCLSTPSSDHAELKLSSPLLSQTDSSGQQSFATDTNRQSEPVTLNDSTEHGCLELAETDPRAALELAITTRLYDTTPGLLENLTGQWAARDDKAAHAWVLQQSPGEWRDSLMARVAYSLSQSNPAEAAQIVASEISEGSVQDEAAISVLHQWALRDYDDAKSWAVTFAPGPFKARALAEVEGVNQYLHYTAASP